MTGTNTFSAVKSVKQSGAVQDFIGDLSSAGNLFEVGNNTMVFKLPQSAIKTLKTGTNATQTTIPATDIFISAQSAQNLSDADQLIDIQSNGAGYDFSTFYVEVLEHFSDIGHLDNLYPEEVSNELKEGSKKLL